MTAKKTLLFESIGAYSSFHGPNNTYTISFEGPYATCTTTKFNETVRQIIPLNSTGRAASFSAGWSPRLTDTLHTYDKGWWYEETRGCGDSHCRTRQYPVDFFFSQHRYGSRTEDGPIVSGQNLTYERETEQLLCKPSRAIYTVNTTYFDGNRHLEIRTGVVEALGWVYKFAPRVGSKNPTPAEDALSIPTINLHSIIGSFVTPLAGTVADFKLLYNGICAEGKVCQSKWTELQPIRQNDADRKFFPFLPQLDSC